MNKIAITLALVAVCIGVVAANKHRHSEDHEVVGHRHTSKFDFGTCEEECNYVCKNRYYPTHGYEYGHGFEHGHGHGPRIKHGKGSHKGGKGKATLIDFYPGEQGPYFPNTGDNGFRPAYDFPGGDFVEHGHHHKSRKQHGKHVGTKKGGFKKNDIQFIESQGGKFAAAELDRSQFDLVHENDDINQASERKKVTDKDLTFIRDKSHESDDTKQSSNEHHQFDGLHGLSEHAHGFAAN